MKHPQNILFFDIETVVKYKTVDDLKEKDLTLYEILLDKFENSRLNLELEDYYKNRCAVLPVHSKMVCVTFGIFNKENKLQLKTVSGTEEDIVKNCYSIINKANANQFTLSGYNILQFDIPYLNMKFLKYGYKIPNLLKIMEKKPWEMNVFDIYKELNSSYWSLSEVAYELNIGLPIYDGKEVYKFYYNNQIENIIEHCETDVETTAKIYEKIFKNQI